MASEAEEGNVRVAVRCRPINKREKKLGDKNVFEVQTACCAVVWFSPSTHRSCGLFQATGNTATVTDHKTSHNKKFAFDFVYDENTKQETVHMRCL